MSAPVKQHHDTFSRFQIDKSGKDLTGFVAYCLYKKAKIAWIEHRESATGARPGHDEIEAYFIRTLSEDQIQVYRDLAKDMLNQFADTMLGAELEAAREAIKRDETIAEVKAVLAASLTEFGTKLGDVQQHVTTAVGPLDQGLRQIEKNTSFRLAVGSNVVANIVAAVLIALFFALLWILSDAPDGYGKQLATKLIGVVFN